MKWLALIFTVILFNNSVVLADEEGSILYPKQIQPKFTIRQRCEMDQEWKKYGSVEECVAEKRHQEIIANQKKIMRQQIELDEARKAQDRRDRNETTKLNGMRMFLEGGNSMLRNPPGR